MPFEFCMPDILQELHSFNLICVPALHAYVERIFCVWAAPLWTMKHYVHVSPDESLSKTQSVSAKRNSCPQ